MNDSHFTDYLAGELQSGERTQVDEHLAQDRQAREEFAVLKNTSDLVKEALSAEKYEFSPGELASLRQKVGLSAVGDESHIVSIGSRLTRVGVWVGAAAACITAMFWLINRPNSEGGGSVARSSEEQMGVASSVNRELWAPVSWASDPGADSTGPELIGEPKLIGSVDANELAELHSPDLTKIDGQLSLQLSAEVGQGSFEEIRDALLDRSELPEPGAIRIDELGNYFHQDFKNELALERYSHPWRPKGQVLLARSPYRAGEAKLQINGEGTLRLFGEQTLTDHAVEYKPGSFRPLNPRKLRLWWAEGDLEKIYMQLNSPAGQAVVPVGSALVDWREASCEVRTSLLLIGLGEFMRGSASAPRASDLLAICDNLRSEAMTLEGRYLVAIRMAEAAVGLKN